MSTNTTPGRRFVRLSTAAETRDCSVKHLRRLIAEGKLTGYQMAGSPRALRVDLDELDEIMVPIPTVGGAA